VKPTHDYKLRRSQNILVAARVQGRVSLRAQRQKERREMPVVAHAEKADPDSIYADDDRTSLIAGTRNEQAGRYAEILWLEQKLIGPLRPHKEDRLRKALENTEALYEAQWIELEMAAGSRTAFEVRRRLEAQQDISTLLGEGRQKEASDASCGT